MTQFHDGAYKQITITDNAFQGPGEHGIYYYALSATWLKNKKKRIAEGDSSSVFAIEITGDAEGK
ncbi:hypothetical protein JOC55_002153 [Paenibacillus sacheonensis]|nr:hypothetical protein [Paenibacillus sacheonensis]